MTIPKQESSRLAVAAAITSIAAFAYFSGIGILVDAEPHTTLKTVGRAISAVLVGALLVLRARNETTPGGAAREGLLLAVIVVVSNSLLGSEAIGRDFAIRSAAVLLGLPILAVLSHALGQVRSRTAPDE